ncbi:BBP7 family outer membrane beta-barrel protein [Neorhodopirellula lusitana]|uniref:BBP7 family outer membrane beta-barrel protein n=1 Tax=Neorhodopirellula lusitana TaxID=445327 RepID=UPI00384F97D6
MFRDAWSLLATSQLTTSPRAPSPLTKSSRATFLAAGPSIGPSSLKSRTRVSLVTLAFCFLTLLVGSSIASAQTNSDPYATTGYTSGPPVSISGMPNLFSLTPTWLTSASMPSGSVASNLNPFGYMQNSVPTSRLWLRGEYLYWYTEGMETPALATTSPDGTAQNEAAILGFDQTTVLFGNGKINDGGTHGLRLKGGLFLTPAATFGIEGEYFGLGTQDDGFSASTGRSIVGRPFYDTTADQETAQLTDFPDVVDGSLAIRSSSKLRSYLLAGRASLCPTCGGNCVTCQNTDRVDWIVGYRHLKLEEGLSFQEDLTSLITAAPGEVSLSESFNTTNEFNGLQLGVAYQANLKRVWLESLLRVAVGRNKQSVRINGSTSITEFGTTENYTGGLLAQTTNIGTYQREEFTMVPEAGVTLGVRLFDWMHATAGYSIVYLPAVVRPGDQIDTDVNPGLLPPEDDPLTGSNRPRFRFVESDYWAQGLNLGLQLQF